MTTPPQAPNLQLPDRVLAPEAAVRLLPRPGSDEELRAKLAKGSDLRQYSSNPRFAVHGARLPGATARTGHHDYRLIYMGYL